jgi:hypothetical protein
MIVYSVSEKSSPARPNSFRITSKKEQAQLNSIK